MAHGNGGVTMLFMAVFHFEPEEGGALVAARWQHGPTAGVTVLGAWTSSGYSNEGQEARLTYVMFSAGSREQMEAFTGYLYLVCSRIEIRPVSDYMPFIRAYEAKEPEQYPMYPAGVSEEERRRQMDVFRQYMAAPSPAEAIRIWRGVVGGGQQYGM
ncbi:MAG: hypothetical protein Q7K03_08615 [Dehalococcoidia bacterium]|nr:hypothetical protein [Dehalococcoidia bacterium]